MFRDVDPEQFRHVTGRDVVHIRSQDYWVFCHNNIKYTWNMLLYSI